MATKRQIEANRRNAKKSTGPRTAEGKAKSSRNSLIHGLESAARDARYGELERHFRTANRTGLLEERDLLDTIAFATWLCSRAQDYQNSALHPGAHVENVLVLNRCSRSVNRALNAYNKAWRALKGLRRAHYANFSNEPNSGQLS
jgi:hypothetical protein